LIHHLFYLLVQHSHQHLVYIIVYQYNDFLFHQADKINLLNKKDGNEPNEKDLKEKLNDLMIYLKRGKIPIQDFKNKMIQNKNTSFR
jgi:hypothetical protein